MQPFTPALPLDSLLAASGAHPGFKADALAYAAFRPAERIVVHGHAPRVKVLRALAQLLYAEPRLAIESVSVSGVAGCCDFRGNLAVVAHGEERRFEFVWDCRWRAREAGLVDRMGYPDQSRAAREFGFRCFALWREQTAAVAMTGTDG